VREIGLPSGIRVVGMLFRLSDFSDELKQLFALAIAEVEETNAHVEWVIDSLCDPAEAKGQAVYTKLDFDAAKDPNWKAVLSADAAAAKAYVNNVSTHVSSHADQVNDGGGVDVVPGFDAPLAS
jgi:hypothetical protein